MMKKKKCLNISKIMNLLLTIILFALWVNVFVIHGMAGAVSWALLKLVLAPIGVIFLIACCIIIVIRIIKHKIITQNLITLLLLLFFSFPILMLVNVIPMKYPVKLENISPSLTIDSPFHESVLVGWGGDSVKNNAPHVIWASERWAYDLVIEPKGIDSPNLVDYGIYDKKIYAPIAGVVVAAYDKEEDIQPNTEEFLSMEGNYVYIKIDKTGTYLLLNHLKKDSVVVNVGDKLKVGDYIGNIGNSGSTSEPHLHIHHQRENPTKTIFPIFAEGLPLFFYMNEKSVMPISGDIIKPESPYF